jgi:ribosomal protein S18 acetylase RimI-like enzyme
LTGTVRYRRERGPKLCHKAWVLGVYVTPSARGAGVARALLETLMARAAATPGIEKLVLAVATNRPAAASLYCSLGFQPYGLEQNALKIGDRYIDEQFMVWFTGAV